MYIHSFDRDMNAGLQKTPLYILWCIVIIFIFLLNRSFVFLLAEDKQKNLQLPGSRLQNRPDLDWPNPQLYLITHGLTRSISADRCVGWTWINYHTSAPITFLSLSVCSCCWESSGAVVIHVHPHDTSLSVDWDFCLLMEKWMILVKKITKAEMKINSTANFSQILQQVPHTGTSGFEPQLVKHEKIWTSLENDQCSNTEHQNQTIHAYFMKSSNISCSTVYKPCFCLSLC